MPHKPTIQQMQARVSGGDYEFRMSLVWKNAAADFFRRVNSTLAGREVPLKWLDAMPIRGTLTSGSIAFTDGEAIYINPDFFREAFLNNVTAKSLVKAVGPMAALKGASYHELGHILYTPRPNTDFMRRITGLNWSPADSGGIPGLFNSWNLIEDMRIEFRMTVKYPSVAKYFVPMVTRFLTTDSPLFKNNPGLVYTAIVGRKYMGFDILKSARKAHVQYIKQNGLNARVEDLEAIVNEYRLLMLPADSDRAVELTIAFHNYLQQCRVSGTDDPGQPQEPGNGGGSSPDGEAQPGDSADGSPVTLPDGLGGDEVTGDSPNEGDQSNPGNGKTDGEPFGDSLEEGKSSGDHGNMNRGNTMSPTQQRREQGAMEDAASKEPTGQDLADADGAEGDGEVDPFHSSSVGEGGDRDSDDFDAKADAAARAADLVQELLDLQDEALHDTELESVDSLKIISKSAKATKPDLTPDLRGSRLYDVLPLMRHASRSIQGALNTIRADAEEVWDRGHSAGRLNRREAMNARGRHLNVFDRWIDVGDDENTFEVVICVDQSGSMQGYKARAVGAGIWIIRDACQSLGVPVTVWGYDNNPRMIFRSGDDVSPTSYHMLHSANGTEPLYCLRSALGTFQASQAQHKLLFTLTDGQFSCGPSYETVMQGMKHLGVKSTLIQQGDPVWSRVPQANEADFDYSDITTAIPRVSFNFDRVPDNKYLHDRVAQVGDALRELPRVVTDVVKDISREIVQSANN